MEVTEEELKNMSPEQIAELQKKNCIFCHIIAGRVPAKKVYEDDKCIAVLDINPASQGHMLLIPKEHYQIMPQVPDDVISHLFVVTKHLSQVTLKGLKAQGTTIFVANGMVAGQRAPHFMLHVIPRTENDEVGISIPQKSITDEEYAAVYSRVHQRMNEVLGIKEPAPQKPAEAPSQPERLPLPSKAAPPRQASPAIVDAEFKEEPAAKKPAGLDLDKISGLF